MVHFDNAFARRIRLALLAGVAGAAAAPVFAQEAATDAEALAQANWRELIARTVVPAEGCFTAEYPTAVWARVECVKAPDKMYLPHGLHTDTVGDGTDYAAATANLTTTAVGSFPTVTGVTSEKDGTANVYSLQLNSNFMSTAACTGHTKCLAWEQFVYSSSEKSAFMQYWLIDWDAKCPSGWNTSGSSCWKNSAAVKVPKEAISTLSTQKMSATAVNGGSDTLVFSVGTEAYSTTGADSVTYLATAWQQSEFNIIGDGGGSKATFNKGASITVKVAVTDGTTNAPTCASNAGTTAETNNLTLKACTATGGASPFIQFVESD